jgi:hypothetical protein
MNSYCALMVEKLGIWNVCECSLKSDADDRVESEPVRICYRPRQWVQIQRGPFWEQNAETIL